MNDIIINVTPPPAIPIVVAPPGSGGGGGSSSVLLGSYTLTPTKWDIEAQVDDPATEATPSLEDRVTRLEEVVIGENV